MPFDCSKTFDEAPKPDEKVPQVSQIRGRKRVAVNLLPKLIVLFWSLLLAVIVGAATIDWTRAQGFVNVFPVLDVAEVFILALLAVAAVVLACYVAGEVKNIRRLHQGCQDNAAMLDAFERERYAAQRHDEAQ